MNGRLGPGGPGPVDPGLLPQGRGRLFMVPWWVHLIELALVIAVLVALVLIIRYALRPMRAVGPPPTAVNPALAELDLRYARGEIDHDDYLQRRTNLLGPGQPPAQESPTEPPPEAPPPATGGRKAKT